MVSFMEDHPELATGYINKPSAREKSKNLWKLLEIELNCIGPVTRDIEGWKKVWADYKQNIKRKVRKNKVNMFKTGGGPNKEMKLTETEKKAYDMLNLKDAIYGSPNTKNFGVKSSKKNNEIPEESRENLRQELQRGCEELGLSLEEITAEEEDAITNTTNVTDDEVHVSNDSDEPPVNIPKKNFNKNKNRGDKENALREQINLQKNFYEKAMFYLHENITINKRLLKATEELVELKKEKHGKNEIYRNEKLKLRYEKLKQGKRKLIIEEEKLKIKSAMGK